MNVTNITRSLNRNSADAAFIGLRPDFTRAIAVSKLKNTYLLASDPLTAGNDVHRLLKRMGDNDPLSQTESAYFPWVSALRRAIWNLGGWEMTIDAKLDGYGDIPPGIADLVVSGGPTCRGVVEAKVIAHGSQETLRSRDLAQLAAYSRLVARNGSYDDVWAGLAYIELETRLVRLAVFESARPLVARTYELLRAA